MTDTPKKILLGMLVSNGDCLMATVLARQIKQDFPGCHLTWAISNLCAQILSNNPDIDAIWEVPLSNVKEAVSDGWYAFQKEALVRKQQGEFDEVFFTQIYPANVHRYDGTTRGTIYNSYPFPVTVDATPVLYLYDKEVEKVRQYATQHRLTDYRHVILFECMPGSGQSFMTPELALAISKQLVEHKPDLLIIISTHQSVQSFHERIITAEGLSLRENAELSKYCTLLLGCSSGITWICSSSWAKPLPSIQFLAKAIGFGFASVVYDHKYWNLKYSHIIETSVRNIDAAVQMITDVLEHGVEACRPKYHRNFRPLFVSLLKYSFMFFRRGQFKKAVNITRNFGIRNYIRKNRLR